jgi:hypothetical protein
MWEPRRLTIIWAFTASYMDSFFPPNCVIVSFFPYSVCVSNALYIAFIKLAKVEYKFTSQNELLCNINSPSVQSLLVTYFFFLKLHFFFSIWVYVHTYFQFMTSQTDPHITYHDHVTNTIKTPCFFSPQANYTDRATAACRRS